MYRRCVNDVNILLCSYDQIIKAQKAKEAAEMKVVIIGGVAGGATAAPGSEGWMKRLRS